MVLLCEDRYFEGSQRTVRIRNEPKADAVPKKQRFVNLENDEGNKYLTPSATRTSLRQP